ncbi:hypothetical protein [Bacillus sp. Marseille-P3661]|uniref:hypothetical protein n=1 Tax=Bacillus sp. Marseille-P3661 TaxID=1936234 RepID=UPI000C83FA11|nr:hypothetical protein [Bacillus sp. Marseille-P3661]
MKTSWRKLFIPVISSLFILYGCAGQQGAGDNNQGDNLHEPSADPTNVSTQNINDAGIIPSIDSEKKQTTDEHGGTTHGMGSNVYSLIGSSGLHDGGISSHLESRLSGEGINGLKVFVLDDTVILARDKADSTSNQYDPLQNHVLSGEDGLSGKGEPEGTTDAEFTDDNLEKAKNYMNNVFNGNVQILTITNPEADDLIDKIKANLFSSSVQYNELAEDISTLIKMTKEK